MCEIHSIGAKTKERMIGVKGVPALAEFGIILTGVSEAEEGFSWCRLRHEDTQLLATVSGEGEVWREGKWEPMGPGFAYFTRPGAPHAYRAKAGRKWTVCWVIYKGEMETPAPLPATPTVVPVASSQLWHAVEGACGAAPREAELWIRLIHQTVLRALKAGQPNSRLPLLWTAVNADLARNWTLDQLARIACMSKENLRRVCLRELGSSPMRQLTRLRVERAAELLACSSDKLVSIAERIGYGDPFSFSVAFKRETGVTPSAYRQTLTPG